MGTLSGGSAASLAGQRNDDVTTRAVTSAASQRPMNHPVKLDAEVSQRIWLLSSFTIAELTDRDHSVGYSDTFNGNARRKRAQQPRRQPRVQHDEHAAIVGAPDQPAIGLLQAQPRQHVVIGIGAGAGLLPRLFARTVEDVGPRP